jgi:cobalt-zinc-cadmium efflux system membrane fusion protein
MKALAIKYIFPLLFLFLWSCKNEERAQEGQHHQDEEQLFISKEQADYIGLETKVVKHDTVYQKISVIGEIGVPPQGNVTISAIANLQILSIKKLVGDRVRAEEVIAYATSPMIMQWQRDYLSIQETLELAQKELERQSTLNEQRINARKNYEQALTSVQKAKAELDESRSRLKMIGINPDELDDGELYERIPVKAPISGKISGIYVKRSQFIREGSPVFGIVNTHHLHAELKVFEKGLNKVREGQQVLINVPSIGQSFKGHIFLVSNTLDTEGAFAEVHAHFDDEESLEANNLKVGQMLEATIFTNSYQAYQVPQSSVFMIDDQYFVFKKTGEADNGYTFEPIPVKRGDEEGSKVNIELLTSERGAPFDLVTKGAYFLASMISEGGGHHN